MKKIFATLAAFIAVVMLLSCVPSFTAQADNPANVEYNAHDVEMFRAFLEKADPAGVKNGKKINELYNPDDPATWTGANDGLSYNIGVNWDTNGRAVIFYATGSAELFGAFDVVGCDALTMINIYSSSISSANLTGCISLEFLAIYIGKIQLTELDLSTNSALTNLYLNGNAITELDLSGNPHLKFLLLEYNKLKNLDISNNMELELIMCEGNEISKIDLTGHDKLIELHCNNNKLTDLKIEECPKLCNLQYNYNNIKHLDFSHNPELYAIGCAGNGVTELNVNSLSELWMLECQENALTSLDLRGTSIQDLYCNDNMLAEIIVPDDSNVQFLYCQNNKLTSIDLENMKNMYYFDGSNNLLSEFIFTIKKDFADFLYFICLDNPMKHVTINNVNGCFELFADENGSIGASLKYDETLEINYYAAIGTPNEGASFLGWYDANGVLVSSEAEYKIGFNDKIILYAKFIEKETPTPRPTDAETPTPTPVVTTKPDSTPTGSPIPSSTPGPNPPLAGGISFIALGIIAIIGGSAVSLLRKRK
ncbi:MAG: hypothetical protein RRY79_05925 [Clostridia bacterium]